MKKLILFSLIFLSALTANSQCSTEYKFRNPSLSSGVYKFTNVINGVDAFITPIASNNATLNTIDDSTNFAYGWNPIIQFTNTTTTATDSSWVEFLIEFKSGSTPDTQSCITLTAIDLDGTNLRNEYVQSSRPVNVTGYIMTPITWSVNTNWHTAYGGSSSITGPDTLAFDGMAAFNYSNVQRFKLKIGILGRVQANQTNPYYFYCKYFDSLPVPLPVKWIKTSAKKENGQYKISWITDETKVSKYVVEQLINNDWRIVSVSDSKGYGLNEYSSEFGPILDETAYFRIKQIDYDGNFGYSQVLSVSGESFDQEILIFYDSFGIQVYEGTYLDFLNIANYGELYISSTGKKFVKI